MDKKEIYRVTQFSMENNLEATQDNIVNLVIEANKRNKMVTRIEDPLKCEIVFYEVDMISKELEIVRSIGDG